MNREELVAKIKHDKIIVIIRRIYGTELLELARALSAGGISLLEVTFDQTDPDHLVKTTAALAALQSLNLNLQVGAGTVLSLAQLERAAASGAEFIISPDTNAELIGACRTRGLVSIPGALTPSEINQAHRAGADFVKVFPIGYFGCDYIKDVRAPLGHIPLLATGGISESNIVSYLQAGCCGAGIGGRLSERELIEAQNWGEFERRAATFVRLARS